MRRKGLAPQVKQRVLGSRDAPSKPLIRKDLLKMHRHGLLAVTVSRKAEPAQAVHTDSMFGVARSAPPQDHEGSGFRRGRRSGRPPHHRAPGPRPFHLTAKPDGNGKIVLHYRPVLLIDAIWQQFACELAGIIHCVRCPAPTCARWFLRSVSRSDRQYCSPTCRMRAWRQGESGPDARGPRRR